MKNHLLASLRSVAGLIAVISLLTPLAVGASQDAASYPTSGGATPTSRDDNGAGKPKDEVGDFFGQVGYWPHSMVVYVTRTKPWKEGRRQVLDWGCGGGSLSRALAQKDADRIVAVDMNEKAIEQTKRNLCAFPNACARGPRGYNFLVRFPLSPACPGQLGYSSQFDIVVSLKGALSDGLTDQPRIPPAGAMQQAVKACREGGSVIVGDFLNNTWYLKAIALLLAGMFGVWHIGAADSFFNRGAVMAACSLESIGHQYVFWSLMSLLIVGGKNASVQLAFAMLEIARSSITGRWGPISLLCALYYGLRVCMRVVGGKIIVAQYKQLMEQAGLVNVTHSTRFMPIATSPTASRSPSGAKAKMLYFAQNLLQYPTGTMLHIFEGQRPIKSP
jgi:SAM-dependent methyltransferase